MAQDFANGTRRKNSRTSSLRAESRRSLFHWGSFGAGITAGVALTLAVTMWPKWSDRGATATPPPPPEIRDPALDTRFEFFERLPNESSTPRRATKAAAPAALGRDETREFLLQAGSFTNQDDAERLSATLAQSGWKTTTAAVTLSSGVVRHRVIVGPFATPQDTQHAITALRKQDVEALVLTRKPVAG